MDAGIGWAVTLASPALSALPSTVFPFTVLATVGLLAIALLAVGLAWRHAGDRSARLVAAGLTSSCTAAWLWSLASLVPTPLGIPILAHGLFLVAFPLVLAGLLGDPGVTTAGLHRALVGLDGLLLVVLVGVLAVGLLGWPDGSPGIDGLVSTAYPVGDLGRLVVVLVLVTATRARRWWPWVVTFLVWGVADVLALRAVLEGADRASLVTVVLYAIGYLAATWGAVSATGERDRTAPDRFPPGPADLRGGFDLLTRLVAVGGVTLVGVIGVVELVVGAIPAALAMGAVAVAMLVALRGVVSARLHHRQLSALGTPLDDEERSRLEHAAWHDPLTGLPNRAVLGPLERRVTGAAAVLLLDLDGFKTVNDRFGHAVGDDVLRVVAARLDATVREGDVLVRLGGDEFVIVAPTADPDDTESLARRLDEVVRRPIEIEGRSHRIGVSIGIARTSRSREALEDLLERADDAMYAAKRAGEPVRVAPTA